MASLQTRIKQIPYRTGLIVAVTALVAGCSSLGNYNKQIASTREAYGAGDFDYARTELTGRMGWNGDWRRESQLNPWMELGMIEQSAGDFEASASALDTAKRIIGIDENRPVISASQAAGQAATFIINERAQPYYGEPFEKILLPTLCAVNYMMRNEWDKARVEVMQAYYRQQEAAEAHARIVDEARQMPPSNQFNQQELYQNYVAEYGDLNYQATSRAALYQNAFTHYISAVVYNAQGEANAAYVELKNMEALQPGASCAGPLMIETAMRAGFREDLPALEQRWRLNANAVWDEATQLPAEVIVIVENGWAPVKEQITIPVPTKIAIATLALPRYELQGGYAPGFIASTGGRATGTTELTSVEAQAMRSLRDRMWTYVLKSAARLAGRLITEHQILQEARERHGAQGENWSFLLSSLFNVVVEQADLRAWTLLPRDFHVARLRAAPGPTQIEIAPRGAPGAPLRVPMTLRADRPNLILVRYIAGRMTAHTNEMN